MSSLLEQLYDGEIYPSEQIHVRAEAYSRMCKSHNQHYHDFIKTLTDIAPPLAARFTEIMDEQLVSVSLEMRETFVQGFRLGARLMVEVLEKP